jgi:hypothetical protein
MLPAVVLAAAYLIVSPSSADMAAQTFRADLFADHGFLIWNNFWYSGHYLPGYSVIYPPLGALLGPRLVGALAAVAAAACFGAIARHRYGGRARLATWWFGAATVTNLITGRITFALGLALALAAMLALQRRRGVLAPLLAVLTALASPVAALFVALAGAAVAAGSFRRPAAIVALAAFAVAGVMSLAFPTDGWFPFVATAFLPVPLFALAVLAFAPREERWLRRGIVLYLLLNVAVAVIHTPIGANAARLGALFAGPLFALVLAERRPRVLLAVAVPLLYWQWVAPVRDFTDSLGDPSVHRAYFAPLVSELERIQPQPARIEVPATRDRWESAYLPPQYPIARGWLRQLESDDFGLFTGGHLTPSAYRRWLDEQAIAYVALPDVDFDYLAKDEARLVASGVPYLRPVWRNRDWTLYRVARAQPLAGAEASDVPRNVARVTHIGPADFTLELADPGTYLVRIHYTPYWQITSGDACVQQARPDFGGNWTQIVARKAGAVSVNARFSIDGLLGNEDSCSG